LNKLKTSGLLCAILGNGTQFLCLFLGLMLMAFAGMFHVHHHGSFNSAVVLLYAFTCGISGYVSNRLYKAIEGPSQVSLLRSFPLIPQLVLC
jgi:transmembrane 9 superfamily protein 1